MLRFLYTPSAFKIDTDGSVQGTVEHVMLYLLCPAHDSISDYIGLLSCVRRDHLVDLHRSPIVIYKDPYICKLQFPMGNIPALDHESGYRMGGNFPDALCGLTSDQYTAVNGMYGTRHRGLYESQRDMVTRGVLGRAAMITRPYNTTYREIARECSSRSLPILPKNKI